MFKVGILAAGRLELTQEFLHSLGGLRIAYLAITSLKKRTPLCGFLGQYGWSLQELQD